MYQQPLDFFLVLQMMQAEKTEQGHIQIPR